MAPSSRRLLKTLRATGYKSFRNIEVTLAPINILIGANGAGKSNFISLFKLLRKMARRELQMHIEEEGGASAILHHGPKTTSKIEIELEFSQGDIANFYRCELSYAREKLLITQEEVGFQDKRRYTRPKWGPVSDRSSLESNLPDWARKFRGIARYVYQDFHAWEVYHFHDTSRSARIKQMVDIYQTERLWWDAGNLAAYLYHLKKEHPDSYERIVYAIGLVAPFFADFYFQPRERSNPPRLRLEWRLKGSDMILGPESLSDGTLRFMCLATLFLQPPHKQPPIILIDEPELGLHPYALFLLAEMVKSASHKKQVIMTSQSPFLISYFEPEDILVVDIREGYSTVHRLDRKDIQEWLKSYTLGELWTKNLLGGQPEYFPYDDLPF